MWLWTALILIAIEVVVFAGNGLRCPLTALAVRYGGEKGATRHGEVKPSYASTAVMSTVPWKYSYVSTIMRLAETTRTSTRSRTPRARRQQCLTDATDHDQAEVGKVPAGRRAEEVDVMAVSGANLVR